MRILIQRVKSANVVIEKSNISEIGKGFLLLVGIGKDDTREDIEYLAKKLTNLRIFEDEHMKLNLNIRQVNGQVLSCSQFTLYADTSKGNRPGFEQSAGQGMAKEYLEKFNNLLRENGLDVREGVFGAHMEVGLINDGPVTVLLDSKNR